jgi:hypothetical protein
MAGQNASLHPSANALGIKPAALRLVHDTGHVGCGGSQNLLTVDVNTRLLVGSAPTPSDETVVLERACGVQTDTFNLGWQEGAIRYTPTRRLQLNSGVTLRSGGRRTAPCRRGIPTRVDGVCGHWLALE